MSSRKIPSLVSQVIRKFGPVINLAENPEILIEILRGFGLDDDPDGGSKPGGAPPAPAPPGPSKIGIAVTNEEILRVVLKLGREVADIRKSLGALKP